MSKRKPKPRPYDGMTAMDEGRAKLAKAKILALKDKREREARRHRHEKEEEVGKALGQALLQEVIDSEASCEDTWLDTDRIEPKHSLMEKKIAAWWMIEVGTSLLVDAGRLLEATITREPPISVRAVRDVPGRTYRRVMKARGRTQ